jgi:hypothetical protein
MVRLKADTTAGKVRLKADTTARKVPPTLRVYCVPRAGGGGGISDGGKRGSISSRVAS